MSAKIPYESLASKHKSNHSGKITKDKYVRDPAKLAAAGYLATLNPFIPHSRNVETHLKDLVINLTRKIILGDDAKEALQINDLNRIEMASTKVTNSFAMIDNIHKEQQDASKLSGLTQRTIIRMNAFLKGCSIALPDDPLPISRRGKSILSLSSEPQRQRREMEKAWSLRNLLTDRNNHTARVPHNMLQRKRYLQFDRSDILSRLQLYCEYLKRTKETGLDCVLYLELSDAIEARAGFVVEAFQKTAESNKSVQDTLTALIECLTSELIALELNASLKRLISSLVDKYQAMTRFYITFPPSSVHEKASPLLLSMLKEYIKFLQKAYSIISQHFLAWHKKEKLPELYTLIYAILLRALSLNRL